MDNSTHVSQWEEKSDMIRSAFLLLVTLLIALSSTAVGQEAVSSAPSSPSPSESADLVVFGRVWTGDSTRPFAAAVATRGAKPVAVRAECEHSHSTAGLQERSRLRPRSTPEFCTAAFERQCQQAALGHR